MVSLWIDYSVSITVLLDITQISPIYDGVPILYLNIVWTSKIIQITTFQNVQLLLIQAFHWEIPL